MQPLRTPIAPTTLPVRITYETPITIIGSCFAQHIGARLRDLHFDVCLNPMGIIYNPVSIRRALHRILLKESIEPSQLEAHGDRFFHFDFHGHFAHAQAEAACQRMNAAIEGAFDHVRRSKWLIISLGTAHVFEWKTSGRVVANCHKLPAIHFDRKRLTVDKCTQSLRDSISMMRRQMSDCQVLLTVSPVRHVRDGLIENSVSKATLRLCAAQLVEEMEGVHYFPSYEIMLDDLRDYRFYDRDMIHPSPLAIDYIWNAFRNHCIDPAAFDLMDRLLSLHRSLAHRPIHPDSLAHEQFLRSLQNEIARIEQEHARLALTKEKEQLEWQMSR